MINFSIIINNISEEEAQRFYLKNSGNGFNLMYLIGQAYVFGTVTKSKFEDVLDHVIDLNKEYEVSMVEV